MKNKVSLKDVAKEAGTSVSLVSFVLNNKGALYRVNEDTAKRIKEVAQRMNYTPNLAAQSLRNGRSKTIGCIVSDISNPFFAQIAREMENAADKADYSVIFGSSDENAKRMDKITNNIIKKGIDGLIIVPCENSQPIIEKVIKNKIPLVLFDRYFPEIQSNYVVLDNVKASFDATLHLLDSNFKNPVFVSYRMNLKHMEDRIEGYRQAMILRGMEHNICIEYLPFDFSNDDIKQMFSRLNTTEKDSYVFSTNVISVACLLFLNKSYRNLLPRLGIVCYDKNEIFNFLSGLKISYINQPIASIVERTIGILIDHIEKKSALQNVVISGELIEL